MVEYDDGKLTRDALFRVEVDRGKDLSIFDDIEKIAEILHLDTGIRRM